ncbi:MAG: polysaccharide deacetylase family protein [Bacteroidales bacterium]|nr:polysaccharide deacetylase family protein [Bacteroidales bacterium]
MKTRTISIFIILVILFASKLYAQTTLAEKLGFEKYARLLIIHADDAGLCNSVNIATEAALESGAVSSASIMMPCPWSDAFVKWVVEHPTVDVGIHFTLTAEWDNYRWNGVLPADKIPSLLDKQGYLPRTAKMAAKQSDLKEVEAELRAQIDRAIALGIKPTHLDSHMATTLSTLDLVHLFLKLGKSYHLPVLLSRYMANKYSLLQDENYRDVLFLDNLVFLRGLPPEKWDKDYRKIFEEMKPGLNQLILHPAYDNAELQAITLNHSVTNSLWRQRDYDFVTSKSIQSMIKENNIHVITWGEIQKVLFDKTK